MYHVSYEVLSRSNLILSSVDTDLKNRKVCVPHKSDKPEDHWSCIAHLSAEDMLKSAVIEEHLALFSLRTESDNPDATCELSP